VRKEEERRQETYSYRMKKIVMDKIYKDRPCVCPPEELRKQHGSDKSST
jgi:hypothetical protein